MVVKSRKSKRLATSEKRFSTLENRLLFAPTVITEVKCVASRSEDTKEKQGARSEHDGKAPKMYNSIYDLSAWASLESSLLKCSYTAQDIFNTSKADDIEYIEKHLTYLGECVGDDLEKNQESVLVIGFDGEQTEQLEISSLLAKGQIVQFCVKKIGSKHEQVAYIQTENEELTVDTSSDDSKDDDDDDDIRKNNKHDNGRMGRSENQSGKVAVDNAQTKKHKKETSKNGANADQKHESENKTNSSKKSTLRNKNKVEKGSEDMENDRTSFEKSSDNKKTKFADKKPDKRDSFDDICPPQLSPIEERKPKVPISKTKKMTTESLYEVVTNTDIYEGLDSPYINDKKDGIYVSQDIHNTVTNGVYNYRNKKAGCSSNEMRPALPHTTTPHQNNNLNKIFDANDMQRNSIILAYHPLLSNKKFKIPDDMDVYKKCIKQKHIERLAAMENGEFVLGKEGNGYILLVNYGYAEILKLNIIRDPYFRIKGQEGRFDSMRDLLTHFSQQQIYFSMNIAQ